MNRAKTLISATSLLVVPALLAAAGGDTGCSSSSSGGGSSSTPDAQVINVGGDDAGHDGPRFQFADVAQIWKNAPGDAGDAHTSFAVYPSTGTAFPSWTNWDAGPASSNGWIDSPGVHWVAGDFDGNGLTDIAAIWGYNAKNIFSVRASTGSALTNTQWAGPDGQGLGTWVQDTLWFAGDFNGDGKADLANVFNGGGNNGSVSVDVYLSQGSQFTGPSHWLVQDGAWSDAAKWVVGDFDGNGKSDLAAIGPNGATSPINAIAVRLSTGNAFNANANWTPGSSGGWASETYWLAGDFNGDQKSDIVAAWHDIGDAGDIVSLAVYASNGAGFPSYSQWNDAAGSGGWISGISWLAGDFNDDGKTDLVSVWPSTDGAGTTWNQLSVRRSTGSAFVAESWSTKAGGYASNSVWVAGKFRPRGPIAP